MRPIHSQGAFAVGVFLILSVMVMVGARYAPTYDFPGSISVAECSVSCGQDSQLECLLTEHIAYDGYAVDDDGPHGSHVGCESERCAWEEGGSPRMHPSCLGTLNLAKSGDYDRLKAAIAAYDDGAVDRLMRQYAKTLVLNAERESIQVISCDGVPRANLPLDPQQYLRVADAQN